MMTTEPEALGETSDHALPGLADEGDRPSITEVNGTVARFEMAYQPEPAERHPFVAPLLTRLPSMLWFAFSLGIAATVVIAHHSSSSSSLFVWVVERDRGGIPATVLAFIVLASGIATLVRSFMRGVIVHGDGIEARYVLPLGVPRVRRWAWPQIHRMIIDDRAVMLELWTGEYDRLPAVARPLELAALLEQKSAQHGVLLTRLK
jgi:hypothetical protein